MITTLRKLHYINYKTKLKQTKCENNIKEDIKQNITWLLPLKNMTAFKIQGLIATYVSYVRV